jgi:endonuclease YncB( thermonuclease family)
MSFSKLGLICSFLLFLLSGCAERSEKSAFADGKWDYESAIDGQTVKIKTIVPPYEANITMACIKAPPVTTKQGETSRAYLDSLFAKNPNGLMFPFVSEGKSIVASVFIRNPENEQQEWPISPLMVQSGHAEFVADSDYCRDHDFAFELFQKEAQEKKLGIWAQ